MKLYSLVHPGIEELAKQEVEELVNVDSISYDSVVEFEIENPVTYLLRTQATRRVLFALGKFKKVEDIKLETNWKDFFTKETSFKITVEGISGQDNRIEIAKTVLKDLFPVLEKEFNPKIDLKKPDLEIIIFFNGKGYFCGIDLMGEINTRDYRLFPHQASFKGDMAYYFVRKSRFKKGDNLLVGFVKDGSIAIEAAFYSSETNLRNVLPDFPMFKEMKIIETEPKPITINAFDPSIQNITGAKKNAGLAKVNIEINKYSLDELDVKFEKDTFQILIFHVTTKDENQLNELYYQSSYILKKKGTLLIIGRENWDFSISEKFNLLDKELFEHGNNKYQLWLLELK